MAHLFNGKLITNIPWSCLAKNELAMSSPPETQKALLLPAEAADYVIRSVPVPRPSPGQVLVKIHAAALNPLDWKMQKTGLFITRYPIILGMDIAGTVEELGEGVENLSLGDRVFVTLPCRLVE